jgi:endonuclease/exonuclease/phosphatase family metal-dependent hydrolase
MPPFPKPRFDYQYQPVAQVNAVRTYLDADPNRAIPAKAANRLLLATWNIANLGVQQRRDIDHRFLAGILSWFDIIAVQEVHGNLDGLQGIASHLPASYRLLFFDTGGNDERLTFIYDSNKIEHLDEIGEVAPSPSDYKSVTLTGVTTRFDGFDRGPYLVTFKAGGFTFSLVNVHLFCGSTSKADINRRALEAYAIAWWTGRRRRNKYALTKDILPLGDFNLSRLESTDPNYRALLAQGLQVPQHSTQIGSAIASDSHYDQILFFPGDTQQDFTGKTGIIDYDGAAFRTLWNDPQLTEEQFRAYCRYYISDHRPMWAEFKI